MSIGKSLMVAKKTLGGVNTLHNGMFKEHIHTKISPATKKRWDNFILKNHGTLKGTYGSEVDRALNQYIDSFQAVPTVDKKINKGTVKSLQLIARGFQIQPSFPFVHGMVVKTTIKDTCKLTDSRTITKYAKIVFAKSKEDLDKGEVFHLWNISGFCSYVDRLTNTNIK